MKYLPILALLFTAYTFGESITTPFGETVNREEIEAYYDKITALYIEADEKIGLELQCSMYFRITANDFRTRAEQFTHAFKIEREVRLILREVGFSPIESDMFVYHMFLATEERLHNLNKSNTCM